MKNSLETSPTANISKENIKTDENTKGTQEKANLKSCACFTQRRDK